MSRPIRNLSVWGLVKYHPHDFVDAPEAGIKMGQTVPFKDDPLAGARQIAVTEDYERLGFTPRMTSTKCSDSSEVRSIKKDVKFSKKRVKPT